MTDCKLLLGVIEVRACIGPGDGLMAHLEHIPALHPVFLQIYRDPDQDKVTTE